MRILKEIFTWWNSQTLGTRLHTWRKGRFVGSDTLGNSYYESVKGKRRWVIYNGETEASQVSAEWHGWLHHTFNEIPSENGRMRKSWEKPHLENKTGSNLAYHPLKNQKGKTEVYRDYEAWSPEE